jgi:hypothetical protein
MSSQTTTYWTWYTVTGPGNDRVLVIYGHTPSWTIHVKGDGGFKIDNEPLNVMEIEEGWIRESTVDEIKTSCRMLAFAKPKVIEIIFGLLFDTHEKVLYDSEHEGATIDIKINKE